MIKLKKAFVAAAMMLPFATFASDYPWLLFTMTDNTEIAVASDNLDISYQDGSLVLTSPTVSQTFETDLVRSMQFRKEWSGVDRISEAAPGRVDMVTLSGTPAGTFESVDEARATLPSGIYIATGEKGSIKVIF